MHTESLGPRGVDTMVPDCSYLPISIADFLGDEEGLSPRHLKKIVQSGHTDYGRVKSREMEYIEYSS